MKLYRHFTANDEKIKEIEFKRELTMEAYLIENESVLALDEDTFSDVSFYEEEVTIQGGAQGSSGAGRIDILVTYSNEYIGVIELKKDVINAAHLAQLEGYLKVREAIIKQHPSIIESKENSTPLWIGVLVGSGIDPDLSAIINGGYTFEGIPIAALVIKRYRGERGNIYVTTDVIFNNGSKTKDITRYHFNGKTYGKGRLVLAVIKKYVADNPDVTFAELEAAFPQNLQGSHGVFREKQDAITLANEKRKRHFINEEECIQLKDLAIAVCSQWGIGNIGRFTDKAKELSYMITEVK